MERLTKLIVRGRNQEGHPSYAIPLTKHDVELLGLTDDDKKAVYLIPDDRHGLTLQSKRWHDYYQEHSALSEIFDNFWKNHPEIKDRDAYLKKFWEDERRENPDLFD